MDVNLLVISLQKSNEGYGNVECYFKVWNSTIEKKEQLVLGEVFYRGKSEAKMTVLMGRRRISKSYGLVVTWEYVNMLFRVDRLTHLSSNTINETVSPWEKKKELDFSNSLSFKALQDGLEPEYMKPTEIIRNYKKLNTNKLHKRIER